METTLEVNKKIDFNILGEYIEDAVYYGLSDISIKEGFANKKEVKDLFDNI